MPKSIQGIHKNNSIKSKHYFLYFRWFEVSEYSKNFNHNNMFASLHALKWADFAAKFSNIIIISIHVTVSKCNLITIFMVISVHLGQITI